MKVLKKGALKELSGYFDKKKPLFKLLKTDSSFYIYDSGTNKILKCHEKVYNLLNFFVDMPLEDAIRECVQLWGEDELVDICEFLVSNLQKNNFLKLYEVSGFGDVIDKEVLKKDIGEKLNTMGLEVTEDCNLRCSYCVYSDTKRGNRNHGTKSMSTEDAFKAIDYLESNSKEAKEINITFYGGEPLLEFQLIKRVVAYCGDKFKHLKPNFYLTTNGTLLSSEIAGFFAKHKFNVLVSLDGPERLHNRYRRDLQGKGSFQKTLKGLRNLFESYEEEFSRLVRINIVFSPPYSDENMKAVLTLKEEVDFLPEDFNIRLAYYTGSALQNIESQGVDRLGGWAYREYLQKTLTEDKPHPVAVDLNEAVMAKMSQREVFEDCCTQFELHGCCVPGLKRVFVTAKGDFKVCEQIPVTAPFIGNVDEGIDVEILYKNYFKDYVDICLKACKTCWAINLCDSCYVDSVDKNGFSLEIRLGNCERLRSNNLSRLYMFLVALEQKPDLLEYWQSVKLT